jgi:hypothetical protein
MRQLAKTLWINIVPLAALFILLAMMVQASAQPLSCSDQIAELRHHQPPGMGHAPTYERLMFAADLTMAEAQEESGSKELCLQSARQAKQDLQQQPG